MCNKRIQLIPVLLIYFILFFFYFRSNSAVNAKARLSHLFAEYLTVHNNEQKFTKDEFNFINHEFFLERLNIEWLIAWFNQCPTPTLYRDNIWHRYGWLSYPLAIYVTKMISSSASDGRYSNPSNPTKLYRVIYIILIESSNCDTYRSMVRNTAVTTKNNRYSVFRPTTFSAGVIEWNKWTKYFVPYHQ